MNDVMKTELDLLTEELNKRNDFSELDQLKSDQPRLSAATVQATFTKTVKVVESLGEKIKQRSESLEEAMRNLDSAMRGLEEWAAKLNETGHMVAAQVDEANAMAADTHRMVAEYLKKLG